MARLLMTLALGTGICAAGCQRDKAASPERSAVERPVSIPPDTSAADTLIVLERYYTFNHRRAYVVRIEPGGVVRYEGRTSVGSPPRLGPPRVETDTLERGATRRLVAAFRTAGFQAFPDTLLGDRPPCGPTVTDSGLARVALSVGGQTKQVFHTLACPSAEGASMRALGVAIDRATGADRWAATPAS